MALGGGNIKVTTFPGSYINFVSTKTSPNYVFGERGVVALFDNLAGDRPEVVECTAEEFNSSSCPFDTDPLNVGALWKYREIFKHAQKVIVYNTGYAGATVAKGLSVLEAYEFNVLVTAECEDSSELTAIGNCVIKWRNELGKKCQLVMYQNESYKPNDPGIIVVGSTPILPEDPENPGRIDPELDVVYGYTWGALAYWVAGAMAGCAVNKSCTNMLYDGELTINVAYSQSELQSFLDAGKIVFHLVYGEIRMLEDVNSLTSPSADQSTDFKYNQTIRVIDQIANDIAYLFNTKYLGRIQNNASGRISLWNDIVTHHKQLETLGAIEDFKSENVIVQEGDNIRSVVVTDIINIVGTMSQLFMTVVIE